MAWSVGRIRQLGKMLKRYLHHALPALATAMWRPASLAAVGGVHTGSAQEGQPTANASPAEAIARLRECSPPAAGSRFCWHGMKSPRRFPAGGSSSDLR